MPTDTVIRLPAVTGPEYLKVTFSAKAAGATIDPDSGDGYLALLTDKDAEPADSDWNAADVAALGSGIVAKILIGVGTDLSFAKGDIAYPWLKWDDGTETIIRRADKKIRFD